MYNILLRHCRIFLWIVLLFVEFFNLISCQTPEQKNRQGQGLHKNIFQKINVHNQRLILKPKGATKCPNTYLANKIKVRKKRFVSKIKILAENEKCTIYFSIEKKSKEFFVKEVMFQEQDSLHKITVNIPVKVYNIGRGKQLQWDFSFNKHKINATLFLYSNIN